MSGSSTTPRTAVLWDIDGTLLRARGAGTRAFTIALAAVTGHAFPSHPIDMGGNTDPMIAAALLAAVGVEDESLIAPLLAEVERAYEANEDEFRALTVVQPGIVDALAAMSALDAVQTIVTGNLESVARRKIAAAGAGIGEHLRFELGGYSSDHAIRAELVRLSRTRIEAAVAPVEPHRTWVIGDTPRDFECARANGVRCILVATGTFEFSQLDTLGADAVFRDLSDTARLLETMEM